MTLESLSNQEGDGNENGKSGDRFSLTRQQLCTSVTIHFFASLHFFGKSGDRFSLTRQQLCTSVTIHFFAVVTGLLHETSREHKTTSFVCYS